MAESAGRVQCSLTDASRVGPCEGAPALHWYWVSATYKAVHPGATRRRHLWERTVFLVCAHADADARVEAVRIAKGKQQEYVAAKDDLVRWELVEIEGIQALHDEVIGSGTEVYWEFFERVDRPAESLGAPEDGSPESMASPGAK